MDLLDCVDSSLLCLACSRSGRFNLIISLQYSKTLIIIFFSPVYGEFAMAAISYIVYDHMQSTFNYTC